MPSKTLRRFAVAAFMSAVGLIPFSSLNAQTDTHAHDSLPFDPDVELFKAGGNQFADALKYILQNYVDPNSATLTPKALAQSAVNALGQKRHAPRYYPDNTPPAVPVISENLTHPAKAFETIIDYIIDLATSNPDNKEMGKTSIELMRAAIDGMTTNLDPHSSYYFPDQYEKMQTAMKGHFSGIGAEVKMEDGKGLRIVNPMPGSAALEYGIKAKDLIIKVDGEDCTNMPGDDVVNKIRGPFGSEVTLTILRDGQAEPLEKIVVRGDVKQSVVKSDVVNNVGYIKIQTFMNETVGKDVAQAMDDARQKNPDLKGFIIDVRDNLGGLLDQVIEVADTVMDHGPIVSQRERMGSAPPVSAHVGNNTAGLPVVVLINGGSASASEILAQTLQDAGLATVIGTQSFGKGSVQTVIPLASPLKGALHMTTATYHTNSGKSPQKIGVGPNILAEFNDEHVDPYRHERDEAHALENPDRNAKAVVPSKKCTLPEHFDAAYYPVRTVYKGDSEVFIDTPLACAIDLFNDHSIFTVTSNYQAPAP